MVKVTRKCTQCGTAHRNSGSEYGGFKDYCHQCELILSTFDLIVDALNQHVPINTGIRNRRLIIDSYHIEKY